MRRRKWHKTGRTGKNYETDPVSHKKYKLDDKKQNMSMRLAGGTLGTRT